jgi:hypothetical protein
MAKLTAAQRKALPDSAFAIPSKRAYPIHDKAHRDNAKGRVTQHGSPSEKKTVRAAVAKREGGGKSKK